MVLDKSLGFLILRLSLDINPTIEKYINPDNNEVKLEVDVFLNISYETQPMYHLDI